MPVRVSAAAALGALLLVACAAPAPKTPTAAATSPAASAATPAAIDEDAGYLGRPELPDAIAFLPPPPSPGSAALALDEDTARAALTRAGSPRYAVATGDAEWRMPAATHAFECTLGITLDAAQAPALQRLLTRLRADASHASSAVKKHYQRARPFVVNGSPSCKPDDEEFLRSNGSYPSGHALLGWAWALALAEVTPERTQALLARGRDYGDSRVVCNVHWQSDVRAGRELADLMVARVRSSPEYRRDIDAARTEFAALTARGARPARDCAAEAAALATPALNAR